MAFTRRDAVVGLSAGLSALTLPRVALAAADAGPAPGTLSNSAASPAAKALYRYLWSIYRRHTLTGQQESVWTSGGATVELDYIRTVTGKLPAVLGLDYIDPADNANVNDRATAWYRGGGIPTICWHWGAPDVGTGYENSKKDFDVAAALRPGTPQNRAMMRDMADVADHLAVLRDRDVPVLWRPFHEFSGDWFWWGKHGPAALKSLWALMYGYFTRTRALNNLIWVAGYAGQNMDPAWYPGRATVDVAGADIYVDDHGNLATMFGQVRRIVGDSVPICLHECGPIPDPAGLGPDADWLYFLVWHTKWIMDGKLNPPDQLRAAYASQRYLTKDELGSFKPA